MVVVRENHTLAVFATVHIIVYRLFRRCFPLFTLAGSTLANCLMHGNRGLIRGVEGSAPDLPGEYLSSQPLFSLLSTAGSWTILVARCCFALPLILRIIQALSLWKHTCFGSNVPPKANSKTRAAFFPFAVPTISTLLPILNNASWDLAKLDRCGPLCYIIFVDVNDKYNTLEKI